MATTIYSGNVTKYNAGGSGDNIVPDGYIKTVEKVWVDSYTMAWTTPTVQTLDIAVLPKNKKVVGIDVEILTTAVLSEGTLSIGFSSDASVDTFLPATALHASLTRCSISIPGSNTLSAGVLVWSNISGFQKVTSGTQCTVSLLLDNWTASSGTIKTKVRYT